MPTFHIPVVQQRAFINPAVSRQLFQSMTNEMQCYTVFYFCKLLYMFRVDPPSIIRSTTLYLQHLVFVKL